MQRLHVGLQQPLLAPVLLGEQGLDHGGVDVHQHRQRTDIHDVLEQLALARVLVGGVADRGHRHADHVDVVAKGAGGSGPRAVVEQVAAGLELGARPASQVCGFIATIMSMPPRRPSQPRSRHAHLVPGRQALDVAREDVARADRHAHAQDRLGEQLVGRGRARAVDVGELDDEVVDGFQALHLADSPSRRFADLACCRGRPARHGSLEAGTSACPRRRSGSARRTGRSAGRRLRP